MYTPEHAVLSEPCSGRGDGNPHSAGHSQVPGRGRLRGRVATPSARAGLVAVAVALGTVLASGVDLGGAAGVHTSSAVGMGPGGAGVASETPVVPAAPLGERASLAEELLAQAAQLVDEGLALPAGLPINSSVRSEWGMRMHPIKKRLLPHHGIDLRCVVGTPVHSTADGIVLDQGYERSAGRWVRLQHGQGYGTLYAHLDSSLVRTGAVVRSGEVIALSGSSGAVTAPHLHYEVNWGGTRSDSLSLPVGALAERRDSLLTRAEQLIERAAKLAR